MAHEYHQVVIVGAGPAGLALGAELCRRGVNPLILDRLEAGSNTSRAAVVHARTLEVLKPLSVTSELLANGVAIVGQGLVETTSRKQPSFHKTSMVIQ